MAQLLFRFTPREEKLFDGYHASDNVVAVAALECLSAAILSERQEVRQIYLWGPVATGKSHLLQAACRCAGEAGGRTAYLPIVDLRKHGPQVLGGLEGFDLLCLDDIDAVLDLSDWQRALFELINSVRAGRRVLVMAGESNPAHCRIRFKDLASRLAWGEVYHLKPLHDKDKVVALCMTASRLGFDLPKESAAYLLNNYPRELGYLTTLVKFLGRTAQEQKRRVTIPFIKHAMTEFRRT